MAKPTGKKRHVERCDAAPDLFQLLNLQGLTENDLRELRLRATRQDLFASILHEISNPLTAILAHLEIMREESGDDPIVAGHLDVLVPQMERLVAILLRVRTFARTPVGPPQPVDVGGTLQAVEALLSYHYHANSVALQVDVPQDFPSILGDAAGLQQMWLNYLANAFNAIRRRPGVEGCIRINAHHEKTSRQVVFEITDNGVGMDAETLAALSAGTLPRRGIGVRECARIVAEHAGTVTITSRPGRGTTVRVTLPTGEVGGSAEAETPPTRGT